jgi:hypothetical protein
MHMNDDDQLEAAEDEAVEAADGDEGEAPSREDEARKQGWVPRSEFRGDPEDWTPADEYLRMGDPKYLRKALRDQKKEVRKLAQAREQDAQAFAARLDRFEAMSKAQRAKLYGDIETARRQAVEAGDTAEYDRLNKVEADLYEQEQAAGKTTAKKDAAKADEPHPDVEAWVQENQWFVNDEELNFVAQGIHARIAKAEPGLSVTQNLAKVKREVERRYPEKFGKSASPAKTNGHSAVEGGQRTPAAAKGKGFTDIPAEERRIIERHIEEGLYKDKAEAAKAYWS